MPDAYFKNTFRFSFEASPLLPPVFDPSIERNCHATNNGGANDSYQFRGAAWSFRGKSGLSYIYQDEDVI